MLPDPAPTRRRWWSAAWPWLALGALLLLPALTAAVTAGLPIQMNAVIAVSWGCGALTHHGLMGGWSKTSRQGRIDGATDRILIDRAA